MEKTILIATLLLYAGLTGACSGMKCNNIPQREAAMDASKSPDQVKVYKYTGEKQCGVSAGIPLEQMKETLTKNKIEVYDSATQPDGKMHIQSCGASVGNIHVFTISKDQLKRALALGFNQLN